MINNTHEAAMPTTHDTDEWAEVSSHTHTWLDRNTKCGEGGVCSQGTGGLDGRCADSGATV